MRNSPKIINLFPAICLIAVACGGTVAEPVAPPNNVSVITDTSDLCDAKLQACANLVARGIDSCAGRAQLAAIQQCVGESVQCVNDALSGSNNCYEAQDLCLIQGSPEIRACARVCRDTLIEEQFTCTSSLGLALDDCSRRLSMAGEACRDQGARVFDVCLTPARVERTQCEGDVQVAYNLCVATLDERELVCRMECSQGDESCFSGCGQSRETMRIRCDTERRLGFTACDSVFYAVEARCRTEGRTAREVCEGAISADTRTCSDQAFRNGQLCQQRAGDRQEDCARGCDPLGAQRCNMHCNDAFYASYGECFRSDWTCFANRSNEGSLMCEAQGEVKIEECFKEAEGCKDKQ